jgi:beta-glucosidase
VAYPFGYGLSYTTFEYSKPKAKVNGNSVNVEITITNTGSKPGKEVAQVYVTAPSGQLELPAKELKAFAKTRMLQPGESQTLTMTIDRRLLTSFDEQHSQWLGQEGQYTLHIGASVADIRCTAAVRLSQYTEPVNNVMAPQQPLNLLHQ